MTMINHKLNAFTIMEVTIALLVSGILIAIVYVAFAVVSNSYHAFLYLKTANRQSGAT
jgi:prepilin-type N-terminal cleavage/methylation domain-containing protein